MKNKQIRLSGSGGQGMILAGVILAEASINDGLNAIQTQSYGPEARGGASKSEVIISDDNIDFPKVRDCGVLLSLNQKSYEKYSKDLNKEGILIVDSSVDAKPNKEQKVYSVPIIDTAYRVIGKPLVTNIVALGAVVAITKTISKESAEKAVLKRVPKGTEELNKKAFHMGYEIAEKAMMA